MHLQGLNFRLLGDFPVDGIAKKIEGMSDFWEAYKFRQIRFKDHSETKTIPLIWSERYDCICIWKNYWSFRGEIQQIESFLAHNLGPGKLMTAIFINLPAGKDIKPHIDKNPNGKRFDLSRRIHIPIVTNPDCVFEIAGEEKNMKVGEIWEISNVLQQHSVNNKGESDRIHLLLDWIPDDVYENYIMI